MTQRYVAPLQIVSVQPDYPRYSAKEDRRRPEDPPSSERQFDPHPSLDPSPRDFKAIGLLLLLAALAIVVVLSFAT